LWPKIYKHYEAVLNSSSYVSKLKPDIDAVQYIEWSGDRLLALKYYVGGCTTTYLPFGTVVHYDGL
jgi:hypothetical protein